MNDADTTPTTPERPEPIDWSRFDAMSAEARHRAALDDPDAQPRHPRRRPLKRNGHGGRTKQSKPSGGGTPNGGRSCRRISRPWNANWRSGPVIGSGWRGTSPHRQRGWPINGANWREPSGPRRRRNRRSTPWRRLTPTGARSTSWACCCWRAFPAADAGRFRLGSNGSRRLGPRANPRFQLRV